MTAKVLITGAGSGIGLAVARRVVARGMRAILWDISAAALQAAQDELGDSAEVRQVDVSDVQAVTGAAASLEGVSHLVNNAGILGRQMDWGDLDPSEIARVLAINVTGFMQVASCFIAARRPHSTAAIVNMASIAGENGGAPGFASYGASKGAIIALTRAMARDFAPEVRVNALAPGIIDTPIQDAVMADAAARARAAEGIPMQRMGSPDEVAEATEWLLFDAAYTTGEIIRIAGGRR
ncbi:2-(s)-hydroxypropyl-com dehydrogenase [Citreicella sp. SE45]|uniref:SDR family NAD(P)-dependent oxidoreductase n=1 Tax=Salipiger sp. HF18 TaxID=2721557 RepID=UPI0001B8CE49|nr:SDR family oxidoreductase [Salipiger sp. HF18]EEX11865.1 2-(s)-hydroxypropyl-com dehydrogenase [Citreicella sp. SE45]MAU44775.1 NAD(P)-dependent oxidoreductase [Salipiger sp.]NIY94762.1 SDR family oxidoreductase [Salipiger sp. HF18]NVK62286.1 SDR family oxidoreductase [Paracoccaceae bacterium]